MIFYLILICLNLTKTTDVQVLVFSRWIQWYHSVISAHTYLLRFYLGEQYRLKSNKSLSPLVYRYEYRIKFNSLTFTTVSCAIIVITFDQCKIELIYWTVLFQLRNSLYSELLSHVKSLNILISNQYTIKLHVLLL